jgi:hypothetical protein
MLYHRLRNPQSSKAHILDLRVMTSAYFKPLDETHHATVNDDIRVVMRCQNSFVQLRRGLSKNHVAGLAGEKRHAQEHFAQ